MVFDGEERQVAALVAGADGFVLGSDPVVVHKSALGSGTEPTWTSKPLDAGLPARFGTLSWNGEGALVLETRSGNTQVPEGSWSTWEPVGKVGGAGESRGSIASPKARYLQIRARFVGDRRGVLSDISANFQTENARPIVTEISLSAKGGTLVRELGTGVVASGAEPAKRDTMIKLGWKVENADNDALRYRVSFRREGQTAFRELQKTDEFLTKTDFDWDTTGLAEGRYRVRVEASDDAANPLGTGQKHAKVSDTVVVDNTPPTLNATLDGRRLRGEAKDSTSPIVRVDVAIDGRSDFRPLAAKDGVFDSPDENLETDLAAVVPAGTHLVVVRVWDAAGNVTSKEFDAH
jgi:hypothetical protein